MPLQKWTGVLPVMTPLDSLRFTLKASVLAAIVLSVPTSVIALVEDDGRVKVTLSSKRELQFPGCYAPFEFRLNDPGEEMPIALCDGTNRGSGIRHKFQEAPFTKIENVRELLESWLDPKSKKRKRSLAYTVLRLPVEP